MYLSSPEIPEIHFAIFWKLLNKSFDMLKIDIFAQALEKVASRG